MSIYTLIDGTSVNELHPANAALFRKDKDDSGTDHSWQPIKQFASHSWLPGNGIHEPGT